MPETKTTLSPFEYKLAQFLVDKIMDNSKNPKKVDESRSILEIDLLGHQGQIAFCKMLNLYQCFDYFDGHSLHDCMSRKGTKIDVKTTDVINGNLIVPTFVKQTTNDKIYALVIKQDQDFIFKGWAWDYELFKPENIKDETTKPCFKYNPVYFLSSDKLHKI